MTASDNPVLFDNLAGIGRITLNRPQVHNALSLEMIRLIQRQLREWQTDTSIHAILLAGAGDKAFCAGGDVRAIHDAQRGNTPLHAAFFPEEYRLDHLLWQYPKPVIALMHGITMGGGMGLAQAAHIRIATDKTRMAMPETGIGLIPDVGGSFFLSRMPLEQALYLGLTGSIIHTADARYCGLADIHLPADALPELLQRLQSIDWRADPGIPALTRLKNLVWPLAGDIATPPLAGLATELLVHFSQPDVGAILRSLGRAAEADQPWAQATLKLLLQRSPLSMALVHRQLTTARRLGLADCFRMEYNLVMAAVERGDFMEGVRALLVDKDNQPAWRYAHPGLIDDALIDSYFPDNLHDPDHALSDLGRH